MFEDNERKTMKERKTTWVVVIAIVVVALGTFIMPLSKTPKLKEKTSVQTEVLVEAPPLSQVTADTSNLSPKVESEGDKKLRELGFDPKRGHSITMVVKSNTTNKTSQ